MSASCLFLIFWNWHRDGARTRRRGYVFTVIGCQRRHSLNKHLGYRQEVWKPSFCANNRLPSKINVSHRSEPTSSSLPATYISRKPVFLQISEAAEWRVTFFSEFPFLKSHQKRISRSFGSVKQVKTFLTTFRNLRRREKYFPPPRGLRRDAKYVFHGISVPEKA